MGLQSGGVSRRRRRQQQTVVETDGDRWTSGISGIFTICFLWLFGLGLSPVTALSQDVLRQQCGLDCQQTLTALPSHGQAFKDCSWYCRVADCRTGCFSWNLDGINLASNCYNICQANVSEACVSGCRNAEARYYNHVRNVTTTAKLLRVPVATSKKLELSWELSDATLEAVVWRIQLRPIIDHDSLQLFTGNNANYSQRWLTASGNIGISGDTVITSVIEGDLVKPYLSYEVRLTAWIGQRLIAYSSSNKVRTAAAKDITPDAPNITKVFLLSEQLVICWTKPVYANSAILAYSITMESPDSSVSKEVESTCVSFDGILSDQSYRIVVKARNIAGYSVAAQTTFNAKSNSAETNLSADNLNTDVFYYANKSHVYKVSKTDFSLSEAALVYVSQSPASVTAIAASQTLTFVAKTDGEIIQIPAKSVPELRHKLQIGPKVTAMVLNWFTDDLLLASDNTIVKCSAGVTECQQAAKVEDQINSLSCDPRFGYVYYTTAKGLFRSSLANLSEVEKIDVFPDASERMAVFTDQASNKLLISSNRTVYAYDPITAELIDIRPTEINLDGRRDHVDITSLVSISNRLYWISQSCVDLAGKQSCLYGEQTANNNRKSNGIEPFILPPATGQLVDISVITANSQPVILQPRDVTAIFTDDTIAVNWLPPEIMPFQAWDIQIPWRFELVLRLDGRPIGVGQTNTNTSHVFNNLKASTLYTLAVKACWDKQCSEDVSTWGKTGPLGAEPQDVRILIVQDNVSQISGLDSVGNPSLTVENPQIGRRIKWMTPFRTENNRYMAIDNRNCLYSIDDEGQWTNLNFAPCARPIGEYAGCFQYEFSGNMLYWCDTNGLYRSEINSTESEFVSPDGRPISTAILSSEALIVLHYTDSLIGLQFSGALYKQYYVCESSTCEVIAACTYNVFHDSRIYFLVAFEGLRLELHTVPYDGSEDTVLGRTNVSLEVTSMQYYFGRFLLQTADGLLLLADADLQRFYKFPVENVELFMLDIPGTNYDQLPSSEIASLHVGPDQNSMAVFSWQLRPAQGRPTTPAPYLQTVFYNVTITSIDANETIFVQTIVDQSLLSTRDVPPNDQVHVWVSSIDYWRRGVPFDTELQAPAAPPSKPNNPRIYVDHIRSPYNVSAKVLFMWNQPIWNGKPRNFKVSCSRGTAGKNESTPAPLLDEMEIDADKSFVTIDNLLLHDVVKCKVTAVNTELMESAPSDEVSANILMPNPSPLMIVANKKNLFLIDSDADNVLESEAGTYDYATMSGQRLLAISQISSGIRLVETDDGSLSNATEIDLPEVDVRQWRSAANDWVGRNVFFAGTKSDIASNKGDTVWKYNLDSAEVNELYTFPGETQVVNMQHDPFKNTLYLVTYNGRAYQLLSLRLANSTLDFKTYNCELVSPAISMNYLDVTKLDAAHLPYVITESGISTIDCTPILRLTNITSEPIESLVIEPLAFILATKSAIIRIDKKILNISSLHSVPGTIRDISLYSEYYRPLPPIGCLSLLNDTEDTFLLMPLDKHSAQIEIKPRFNISSDCPAELSMPSFQFTVIACPGEDNVGCVTQNSSQTSFVIKDLSVDTEYRVRVLWSNFYISEPITLISSFTFNTSQSLQSRPENLQGRPLSPDKIELTWQPPKWALLNSKSSLKYDIIALTNTGKLAPLNHETENIGCDTMTCRHVISGMKSGVNFTFQVSIHGSTEEDMRSNAVSVAAFPIPGTLIGMRSNFSANQLIMLYKPSEIAHVQTWAVQYARVAEDQWLTVPADQTLSVPDGTYVFPINHLKPKTQYSVRLVVTYDTAYNYTTQYTFITNGQRRSRAPGTVPGAPINFRIDDNDDGAGNSYFTWTTPDEGGSQIIGYDLERRDNDRASWIRVANNIAGSAVDYLIAKTVNRSPGSEFRLAARNQEGLGPYATYKVPAAAPAASGTSKTVIIIVVVAVLVVLLLIVGTVLLACRRRKRNAQPGKAQMPGRLPGMQGSGQLDALSHISKDDLDALPHVSRNCITISRQLGQGAFGEVYEGLACNLPRVGPKSLRVAIKTLKEGSADTERIKFLKEAILMSKFHHPNIVQLLGVCLESEPHWIILELMEGGDLLTYLRSCRPTDTMPSQLSLEDLLNLSIDVARGFAYLEQHHHVHRDLAARNCLVSSRDPTQRVVKIADFGMARDIYEGDYYRVEGHGLLPVRWMAPESMIDGVFTMKTDVWSFGVLLWEIMTLGQQPYPGRSNWDVLNFVRIGGRLKSPDYCPKEIYDIMNECWMFEAKDRPLFSSLAQQLEALRQLQQFQTDAPFPPVYVRSSLQSETQSGPKQNSDGQVRLFVTNASGRFQRNEKETQSARPAKGRKTAAFLSFRKQQKKDSAPPPPSKEQVNAGRSPTSPTAPTTNPAFRPNSGESFTTTAEGYEVPLLKNLQNMVGDNRGFVNRGFQPTTPTGSVLDASFTTISIDEPPYLVKIPAQKPDPNRIDVNTKMKPNAPKPPIRPHNVQDDKTSSRLSPNVSYTNVNR